ncbi:MAG: sigma-70 family RNA polymerase sigma factor [Deltaproteobacteria bacterium]|nr:sigma-70 family RNA polymerase sigma factor [Deltaproteobacteria bacterium]
MYAHQSSQNVPLRRPQVTQLLRAWGAGDTDAREQLFNEVYEELKRCAARHLRRERVGHTLQTTALVHEAYDRLVDQEIAWQNRNQFMALAAMSMRRVLVDHARARGADKRGGEWQRISFDVSAMMPEGGPSEILALHEALEGLASFDAGQARVVELRFFGGYSIEETAEILGISAATVKRDWDFARAWLYRSLAVDT